MTIRLRPGIDRDAITTLARLQERFPRKLSATADQLCGVRDVAVSSFAALLI
jgi:hypothetical protein